MGFSLLGFIIAIIGIVELCTEKWTHSLFRIIEVIIYLEFLPNTIKFLSVIIQTGSSIS